MVVNLNPQILVQVFGALTVVAVARVEILVLLVPLLILFFAVHRWFLIASREVKRAEAVTRSPVYAMFSALLKGLSTLRSYGVEEQYTRNFQDLLTVNGSWYLVWLATSRWLGTRLDFINLVNTSALVVLTVLVRDRVGVGTGGGGWCGRSRGTLGAGGKLLFSCLHQIEMLAVGGL